MFSCFRHLRERHGHSRGDVSRHANHCTDFGGAATYLPPNSGLCIPVGTIDQIVDRLALSLDTLYQDESRRIQIGRAALATYADRYSWTAKLALIEGIYARACNHPGKQVRSAPAA
jgi:hypothetical protein